jgi:hypothetical protein
MTIQDILLLDDQLTDEELSIQNLRETIVKKN